MISKFFKRKEKTLPKNNETKIGDFFVVQGGTYGGDYLLLMEKKKDDLYFFVLPDKLKRTIKESDFKRGLENKIVTFIEKVPNSVLKDCKSEYDRLSI